MLATVANTAEFWATFLTATVITQMACIREWDGWEGSEVGGGGGWAAGDRLRLPLRHRQQYCVFSMWHKTVSIYRIGQDCHLLQFGTTYILINVIHWLHRPCSAPSWFDRFKKSHLDLWKPTWLSISVFNVKLHIRKLDFSCCTTKDGFCKFSYIRIRKIPSIL